jgi:hypothetical protein
VSDTVAVGAQHLGFIMLSKDVIPLAEKGLAGQLELFGRRVRMVEIEYIRGVSIVAPVALVVVE